MHQTHPQDQQRVRTPRRIRTTFDRRVAGTILLLAALAAPLGAHAQQGAPSDCGCTTPAGPLPFGPRTQPGDSLRGDDRDRHVPWWLLGGLGVFLVPHHGGGATALGERSPSTVAVTDVPPGTELRVTATGPASEGSTAPLETVASGALVPATVVPWPVPPVAGASRVGASPGAESAALRRFEADQREGITKPLLAAALLEAAACGLAVVYRAHRRQALRMPRTARAPSHAAHRARRAPALAEAMAKLRSASPKPRAHAPAGHHAPATAHHRPAHHAPKPAAPKPPAAPPSAGSTIAVDCPPIEGPIGPR